LNDEKKKLIIVCSLAAVIACVGGFQLLKGKSSKPPIQVSNEKKDADAAATTVAPVDQGPKNPQVANDLPPRDPFQPPASAMPAFASTTPHAPTRSGHVNPFGYRVPDIHPLGGNLSPMGGSQLTSIPQPKDEPFGYTLVGSIAGDKSAALFQDKSGNQKVVPVGGAIDGESRLASIDQGSVTIVVRGKVLRLSMGGNPVEK